MKTTLTSRRAAARAVSFETLEDRRLMSSTITPDFAEPNDTLAKAYTLGAVSGVKTWSGLNIHAAGNNDYLKFTTLAAGGSDSTVKIDFSGVAGDLDLRLYSTSGRLLAYSDGVGDSEQVSLTGLAAGSYIARVYGYNNATNPSYSLTVSAPDVSTPTPIPTPTASPSPSPTPTTRDWTVLVFMAADNNLESYALDDLNEIEAAATNAGVTVAAEIDRTPGYSTAAGNWTDTRRGAITHDSDINTLSSPLTSIGEKNTGDPQTLTDFIRWGVSAFPANHYALVLWDHGGGLTGTCWDGSSSNANISVPELTGALTNAGTHFDMVGFDVCLAAMSEQVYELKGITNNVVASEELENDDGWDYTAWLNTLAADSTMSGDMLSTNAVSTFAANYGPSAAQTLSAVRTSAMNDVAAALGQFSSAVLSSATSSDWIEIVAARKAANFYSDQYDRDLRTFASAVAATVTNSAIKTAASAIVSAVDAAVIANYSATGEGATGLSIYLPAAGGSVTSIYTTTNFHLAGDAAWKNFVTALAKRTTDGSATRSTVATRVVITGPAQRTVSASHVTANANAAGWSLIPWTPLLPLGRHGNDFFSTEEEHQHVGN